MTRPLDPKLIMRLTHVLDQRWMEAEEPSFLMLLDAVAMRGFPKTRAELKAVRKACNLIHLECTRRVAQRVNDAETG